MRPLLLLLIAAAVALACRPAEPAAHDGPAPPDGAAPAAVARTFSRRLPPPMVAPPVRRDTLPRGFVYLRDVDPTILQEMRYATAYNFVGERIDGYEAAECVLAETAARALARVQADLHPQGLSLKVYDCYRPQRAVDHFVRWIRLVDRPGYEGDDERMRDAFFPTVAKRRLFREGYIARRSGHSRGATMDLTVVRLPAVPRTIFPDPADGPLQRCDAPAGRRLDEWALDMGTAYDCLSPLASTDSPSVSAEARANRRLLRDAMGRRGFRNYAQEWWHYTLRDEPYPDRYFDFPIR